MLRLTVVKNDFAAIARTMQDNAAKSTDETLADIEREWKASVPVKTGTYRDDIHIEKTGPNAGQVVTDLDYPIFLEGGTAHMPPHPSMHPAAERIRPQFNQRMRNTIRGT